MRRLQKRSIGFLLTLVLLVGTDLLSYLNGRFPPSIYFLRELLVIALVISLIPVLRVTKFVENKDFAVKLKGLYLGLGALYLVFLVLKVVLDPPSEMTRFWDGHTPYLFSSLDSFLYGLLFSIAAAGILTGMLLLLKDLIYFKRKKSSARNFNLFLVFLGLQMGYANLQGSGFEIRHNLGQVTRSGELLLYILIVLMVVNALRNSWVNYLKKRQKIHCLWLGIPLIVGAVLFQVHVAHDQIVAEYSRSLAALIENVSLFVCIYFSLSFLSLVLHLPTAGIFDRKIREIESLHDLSRTLSSEFDVNQVFQIILS